MNEMVVVKEQEQKREKIPFRTWYRLVNVETLPRIGISRLLPGERLVGILPTSYSNYSVSFGKSAKKLRLIDCETSGMIMSASFRFIRLVAAENVLLIDQDLFLNLVFT